ncbi:MAG: hypothetical protein N838_08970 [Thiohalocapsa sp. PB-PSB1]|jgi:hypothetical protein|nr:MAG: hypothetical protein N838_34765 [Thiohalocapsa sp. PB-PSB1]QQO53470.1 MAG: hypothetical protein N838_08970 [Thiohalocapsa sp. PB-PSB1]HCS92251.1 hypothetical protein [Chromatiaceae bacterium]
MLRQELIFRPQEIVLGVLVLTAGGGLLGLALTHCAVSTAQAISGLLLVHRRFRRLTLDWRIDVEAIGLLRQGLMVRLSPVLRNAMLAGTVILFRQLSDDLDTLGLGCRNLQSR